MTDKKIKVEADVTTRKNVSSGIGKGFGIVIGIFLALIVIAVSCGILISSNAKKIQEKSNEITANAIKEAYRAGEEAQQQIQTQYQKAVEESKPVDEKVKQKSQEFSFGPDSIVKTQNGISLALDSFKYEIKGDNWGKLTEITTTVLNKGNNAFQPKVLVFLYDEKDRKEEWFQTKAEIEFDMWQLGIGEHVTKKAIVNIPFNDLDLPKKLELALIDVYEFDYKPIVIVEKEFIAK